VCDETDVGQFLLNDLQMWPGYVVQLDVLAGSHMHGRTLRVSAGKLDYLAPLRPSDAPAENLDTLQEESLLPLWINAEQSFGAGRWTGRSSLV
jgi:hypothetical protein